MKAITLLVAIGMCLQVVGQGYNTEKAREDSTLIYETYKDQISVLEKAAAASNHEQWFKRSDRDDSLTACAKIRLKKWNNADYAPAHTKDLEGYGTAYLFPEPAGPRKAKYSITDWQIKFITREDGKTKLPYVERTYFSDDGEVVSVVRLDPVSSDATALLAAQSRTAK